MKKAKKIEKIRHSLAHILAYVIKELYSGVKLGKGPAIENGFYYEFDFKKTSKENKVFSIKALPEIEKKMKELIKKNLKFEKRIISFKEAEKIFLDQPYKLDLLKDLKKEKKVSIYKLGTFIDLCKGPHLKETGEIDPNSFKLTKIAGAYWKGKEKNPMLTRIYGIAFENKKKLEDFLKKLEESQRADHRILGKKLEIFKIDKEVGAGLPLWLPKGAILQKIIKDFLFGELKKAGYQWVVTPHIGKLELWKSSGHWELYRENIYSPIEIEGQKYLLKPMNCPFHVKIYQTKIRSWRDLPLKLAEFGTVYRFEKSGTLYGLTRVRGFTQDDAHIWCAPSQLQEQLTEILKQALSLLKKFGFNEFNIYLATKPEKFAGTEKIWKKATRALKFSLKKLNLKYKIDPGGGVFYGPKIDIKIKDTFKREWQCSTIQVDFNLPEKFNIFFINKKGKKEKPIMIHRALVGSLERFIGILLEHYKGALPFWLSPEQIWIIPVARAHQKYALKIKDELEKANFRVKLKLEKETVSKKIREGEILKIPYLLVVGDKEKKNKTVRVRERGKGDIGERKIKNLIRKFKKLCV